MKKMPALALLLAIAFIGCSKEPERFVLTEGTPAYELAKELSAALPSLDPKTVTPLVSGKGIEITAAEVVQAIQDNLGARAAQLKAMPADYLKNTIQQNAVRLAERRLLLTAARQAKITVTPDELNEALQAEYGRANGEQNFLDALKTNGISIEHVKTTIQDSLIINKYLENAAKSLSAVSEEDIRKAYEGDKTATVRHILLLTQGKSAEDKAGIRAKMEGILARARKGEDFAALAKEHSEDPGSKENGGLYENFGRGMMVKPFEDAAFSVPVGQISDIVETEYGFHILQIVGRNKEIRPLDEVRTELENGIRQSRRDGLYTAEISRLKEKAGFKSIGF